MAGSAVLVFSGVLLVHRLKTEVKGENKKMYTPDKRKGRA
jgi:hypothetical protein